MHRPNIYMLLNQYANDVTALINHATVPVLDSFPRTVQVTA